MLIRGVLDRVSSTTLGSALLADTASGVSSLTVEWTVDFTETGGFLQINGDVIAYTAADPDTGVITLATTLPAAATAGDSVDALSPAAEPQRELKAWVRFEEGAEPVPCGIGTSMEGRITEATPSGTLVDVDESTMLVSSRTEVESPLDGSTIDPETLPDQIPTVAPSEVVTVTVTGDAEGLTAVAAGEIHPTTVLDWYLDGVLTESTHSTVLRFPATVHSLVSNVDYSVTVQPRNAAGTGTMSAAATGRLDSAVSAQFVAAVIAAGQVISGRFTFGSGYLDADEGLVANHSNGTQTRIPMDGSGPHFAGTAEFYELVTTYIRILGMTNLVEGLLYLSGGTTAPAVKPRAGTSWTHAAASLDSDISADTGTWRGLYSDTSHWVTTVSLFGTTVAAIDKTTGVTTYPLSVASTFQPFGGVVKVGTSWYLLGQDSARSDHWYVYVYNASWVKTGEWLFTSTNIGRAAIATDGTDLFIAFRSAGSTELRVHSRTVAGVLNHFYILDASWNGGVTGLYVGSADFGASRVVATYATGVRAYTNTGASGTTQTRQTSHEWSRANGEELRGLAWDGTRFHSLGSSGNVWHYSAVVTAASRSITHTWYDNDALGTGQHETEASPALSYTQQPRQWLRVDTDPPSYAGFPDDPNAVRIYVANQRQADLGTGVTSVVYDAPATAGSAAPTSNGFASVSAPGGWRSTVTDAEGSLTMADGAGVGRLGPILTTSTGKLKHALAQRSTSTDQAIATGTWTIVTLTENEYDGGGLTVASSVITVGVAGLYQVGVAGRWDANATGRRILVAETFTSEAVGLGGRIIIDEKSPSSTGTITHGDSLEVVLAAGTNLRLIAFQNSGGSLDLLKSTLRARLSVRRVG